VDFVRENGGGCLVVVLSLDTGLLFDSGLTGGETIEAAAVSARIAMAVYIFCVSVRVFAVVIVLLVW
jgi:hypothetical protein